MYGCESWTIKKAEHWRTDAFELWCWRRLLRVPWTERRSNQSILKEINPEYSLEGLMLKLHYFGHLMQRADSLEKTLMLGKIEGRRRRRWQRMRWYHQLDWHEFEQTLGDSEWRTGKPGGDPDNHNGVITNLEPDILECEVKWALESITTNKASGGDRIPVELFQILKDEQAPQNYHMSQEYHHNPPKDSRW